MTSPASCDFDLAPCSAAAVAVDVTRSCGGGSGGGGGGGCGDGNYRSRESTKGARALLATVVGGAMCDGRRCLVADGTTLVSALYICVYVCVTFFYRRCVRRRRPSVLCLSAVSVCLSVRSGTLRTGHYLYRTILLYCYFRFSVKWRDLLLICNLYISTCIYVY